MPKRPRKDSRASEDSLDEIFESKRQETQQGEDVLGTINRQALDFDFEKACSVTLATTNVYACLVCGRYFQGRGTNTQAYKHALDVNHRVFIHLQTKRVYALPEDEELQDQSLGDIKFVVDPWLSKQEVMKLDKEPRTPKDLNGKPYFPGSVGLNNIKENDYVNVVLLGLSHVAPIRNFFMLEDLQSKKQLAQRFSALVRKIWNPRAFKSHVSPHELMQEVSQLSNKKFTTTVQGDPSEFLSWFLNNLHLALGGSKVKPGSSIVQKVFQGRVKIESQEITARADTSDRLRFEDADIKTTTSPFMILTLDLPPAPLFQDELDHNAIPQVSLLNLLLKYDGVRAQERQKTRVRYRLQHPLPPFLIMNIQRFSKNQFLQQEHNPTIVTFGTRALDMAPYVDADSQFHPPDEPILYDLVANLTHEAVRVRDDSVGGQAEKRIWRAQLKDKARDDQWLEIQDLFVDKESADTLFTKESCIQIWEKRKSSKNEHNAKTNNS